YCAPSFCSMSRRRSEQGKQELPNDQCAAMPRNLKNMAWQACLSKLHRRVSTTNRAVFRQTCANSLLTSKQSILAFAPMKWRRFAFSVLAEDPLPIPSSVCSLTAHFPLLLHVGFLLTHRLTRHLSAEKSLSFYTRKDGQSQRLQPTYKPTAIPSMILCPALLPRDK